MGAADVLPGVSGGTIALITGIYDRLIAALAAVHPAPLRHLPQLHRHKARQAISTELRTMGVPFLLAVGTGVITAVIVASGLLTTLLAQLPGPTYAFFVGLIAASAVLIGEELSWPPAHILATGVGAGIVMAVSTGTTVTATHPLWLIFFAGVVGISAMVLPGLSGALLLLILGQYEYLLGELHTAMAALTAVPTDGITTPLVDSGVVVGTFVTGALLGVVTVAHAVNWAFEQNRQLTLAVLVGLMIGGIVPPGQSALAATTGGVDMVTVGLAMLAGASVIALIDQATGDISYVEGKGDASQPYQKQLRERQH